MALSKYLDPKNDIAFKKIFGSEKNKDILIHFLNDILDFAKNSTIIDIDFLPTILNPEIASQKLSIIDILYKDENGVKYIIETQVTHSKGFEKRAQHYAAKVYSEQAKVGEKYQNLKEIIFIAIADCVIFPDKPHYKSDHVILDTTTYERNLKDFYFTFIELPKFNKNKEELSSIEEKWCYFFKHAHETTEEDLLRIIGNDNIMHKAYTALDQFYWTESELRDYEDMKRIEMDHMAVLEQKIDDVKMEIAKRLLQNGIGIDLIAQSSELSIKQVKATKQVKDLKKYILQETSVVNF